MGPYSNYLCLFEYSELKIALLIFFRRLDTRKKNNVDIYSNDTVFLTVILVLFTT